MNQQQSSLFSKEQDLVAKLAAASADIGVLSDKVKNYESQISWLTEQIKTLKRGQYGTKAERWETEEQMLLFNEAELEAKNQDAEADEDVEVKGYKKKRGHRKALPENLVREVVKIELPAEEQVSAEGEKLKIIGWEVSEKLKYEPAKISVIQYHRAKYGADSGDYEKTAPPVPSVIPKGIATPELLAAIITGKYADGLPLYRMESIFLRQDIELSRGTMSRWMVQVADALRPIVNVLSERLHSTFYAACDETKVQVLKEDGRKAESKSWMWVRSTPGDEKKVILFDYSVSRGTDVAKELFAGFKGFLQTDGLASYDGLESDEVIRSGCHMHARRRFEQAAKDGAKSGQGLAETVMNLYKKLYDIEEEIRVRAPDEKKLIRNEREKPILEEIKSIAEKNKSKVPDKSKIGQAFNYYLNEYKYLIVYLQDGRLNPDNGFTERAIRKFAIGRNNWMFSDTPEGAHASANLYSLVVTAKINGVNVYRALTKLLNEIPTATTIDDYERLAEIILSPEFTARP